ncbi:hypothetical protein [Streptomyces montanisoli]|uniref:Uncharacterized protein n=1 Tax=Streptomyces montanisoli TaxID=2798581 RepID=A0A940M8V8_9ACTN|nr:hypothetical protein [Streptomyces montanisoli]MBP0456452.1 hypothetical protein [Streptomyces montanisoli]
MDVYGAIAVLASPTFAGRCRSEVAELVKAPQAATDMTVIAETHALAAFAAFEPLLQAEPPPIGALDFASILHTPVVFEGNTGRREKGQ